MNLLEVDPMHQRMKEDYKNNLDRLYLFISSVNSIGIALPTNNVMMGLKFDLLLV